MKNTINVILLGTDFKSDNLGCCALGYSQLSVLDEAAREIGVKLNITSVNLNFYEDKNDVHDVKNISVRYKKASFYKEYIAALKKSDIIFDFTAGDSFTDIYGTAVFVRGAILKTLGQHYGKKFILGPQTIGPFRNKWIRKYAAKLLKSSYRVYVRDEASKEEAFKLGCSSILTTDVAFMLKPDQSLSIQDNNKKVGINISGLLWNGGYTGENQFLLKLNYKEFCYDLVKECLDKGYSVYLISHVIPDNYIESDFFAAEEIKKKYPKAILCEKPKSPMHAKSIIGQMDVFIGSRMHATIASFSQGVPTIAVAYSRKFSGLFNSLHYNYVIDGREVDNSEAIERAFDYINDEKLKIDLSLGLEEVKKKNNDYKEQIKELLKKVII